MLKPEDFKEVICSNCNLPLYKVGAKPTEDKTYKINATCPSCGDHAFEIKISGKLIFASSDYCHVKPRPVYLERSSIDEPLQYSDKIIVECQQYRSLKRK